MSEVEQQYSGKQVLGIVGAVFIGLFLSFVFYSQPVSQKSSEKEVAVTAPVGAPTFVEPTPVADDAVKEEQKDTPILYQVTQVVDGDTIKVDLNGTTETLRLIGIDTPETVDPRKPVQCFGEEASKKAKEILTDKKVTIEADPTQGERDKYSRLLRYVFLEDGTFFNKQMIDEGYAHEYTYQSNPYKYQTEFKDAEKSAREGKKGLWSDDTCKGDTTQAAVTTTAALTVGSTSLKESSPTVTSALVKKSTTGICHAPGTTYYAKTKNFVPYDTVEECLNSGGRLPKR
jgi:micrococcal nuclease